jgi:hypothetical protein
VFAHQHDQHADLTNTPVLDVVIDLELTKEKSAADFSSGQRPRSLAFFRSRPSIAQREQLSWLWFIQLGVVHA